MAVNELVENDHLVADLRDALRDGRSGLNYVPKLLRRVLERDAWRKRIDAATHAEVGFGSIDEFVTTPPTEGLGATVELVDRIVGTDDPDLLRLWRNARKVGRGRRTDLKPGVESTPGSKGFDSGLTAQRLEAEAPKEYEAVKRGEKTINRAARDAGIRPHRISVRLDRPDSIARSLRKYMSPDQLAELARLLTDGG